MLGDLIVPNLLSPRGSILIEQDVLVLLSGYRQSAIAAPESGGILLGYRRGPHLHVSAATVPQPGDRQSRFSFDRQERSHQRLATAHWRDTGEAGDYLGEWHTHPESQPTPSDIDTKAWLDVTIRRDVPMLFVILGTRTSLWLGVGVRGSLTGCLVSTSE
jgi:integrative and conjugative element protein (TIGR02256 family)